MDPYDERTISISLAYPRHAQGMRSLPDCFIAEPNRSRPPRTGPPGVRGWRLRASGGRWAIGTFRRKAARNGPLIGKGDNGRRDPAPDIDAARSERLKGEISRLRPEDGDEEPHRPDAARGAAAGGTSTMIGAGSAASARRAGPPERIPPSAPFLRRNRWSIPRSGPEQRVS